MEFSNMKDLFKYLDNAKTEVLETDVADMAVEKMKEHVQDDVYDVYTPTSYQRTGTLKRNVDSHMLDDDTVEITDIYNDYENGVKKNVTKIVTESRGYTWGYHRNLDEEIGPRPFIDKTRKEIEDEHLATEAMKEGLKNKGIMTE